MARVALLVKQGISRSKNKHKPTAVDDSCMWKGSGTYGLFSHGINGYPPLTLIAHHTYGPSSGTVIAGSALAVSAVSGTEGDQLYQSVRCRGQKAISSTSQCGVGDRKLVLRGRAALHSAVRSVTAHSARHTKSASSSLRHAGPFAAHLFYHAFCLPVAPTAPTYGILSAYLLLLPLLMASFLLTCCYCPYLWHPFCLLLATAPTYGILCAYLLLLLPLLMASFCLPLATTALIASFLLTSCSYCPYLWHPFCYLLLLLPLLMASFLFTSCYYCAYVWHLFCLPLATIAPTYGILSAYLLLLPLLMASVLLTGCYCPYLWHPLCLPLAPTAPTYGILSAYLLLLPLLMASVLLTFCSHCPYLWHPFCLPVAPTAPTYGILSVYLLLLLPLFMASFLFT